ncbi:ParM/StbA family protein [Bacillus bombysepticus]|uniref:ParM/StbA family protein n=1 Tax=Bacillus bombysepticus TaxID=658666 RepID=UPI00301918FD
MKKNIVAVDLGNLNVKSFSNGKEDIFANGIRKFRKSDGQNMFGINVELDTYEIEGETYVIGGFHKSNSYMYSMNPDRYAHEDFKRLMLIAVFKHIKKSKQKVTLVTGLPSNHYELESCHKTLEAFKGTYKVNNTEFTIEEVIIEQQALATPIYLGADLKGNIKKNSEVFLNSEVLSINIGMGTTEVSVIYKGSVDAYFSLSSKANMHSAYDMIIQKIRESKDEDNISLIPSTLEIRKQDVEQQIREQAEGKKVIFKASNGAQIDITGFIDESYKTTTDQIFKELKDTNLAFENYSAVVLAGGGVVNLIGYIKQELIAYKDNNSVKFALPDSLEFSVARGYYVKAMILNSGAGVVS